MADIIARGMAATVKKDVEILKGGMINLYYDNKGGSKATSEIIKNFVISKGYSDVTTWSKIKVVEGFDNHVWWYMADVPTPAWYDIGTDTIKVDTELSDTSTNAVQNKAIKAAVDKKLDKITATTADLAYIAKNGGTQGSMIVTSSVVGSSIVKRQSDKHILVLETPTDDNHAASKKYVDDEVAKKNPVIDYIELTGSDGSTGTLSDAQVTTLKASELNYIWLNDMHRLDFAYRDDTNNKATYAMCDLSSDGIKLHSVEINLTAKTYKIYHKNAVIKQVITDGKKYLYACDNTGDILIDITTIGKIQDVLVKKNLESSFVTVVESGNAKIDLSSKVDRSVKDDNNATNTIDNQKAQMGAVMATYLDDANGTVVSFNTASENGPDGILAQIYAKNTTGPNAGKGMRLNITKNGIYYGVGASTPIESGYELATKKDIIEGKVGLKAGKNIKLTVESGNQTKIDVDIKYIELSGTDGATGTLSDDQITVLKASELNYIWLNYKHRLDFKYRDDGNNKSTYAMADVSSDGIKIHSVEIDLTTKVYKIYHKTAVKEVLVNESGTYSSVVDESGNARVDLSNIYTELAKKENKLVAKTSNVHLEESGDNTNISVDETLIDDFTIVRNSDNKLETSIGGRVKDEELVEIEGPTTGTINTGKTEVKFGNPSVDYNQYQQLAGEYVIHYTGGSTASGIIKKTAIEPVEIGADVHFVVKITEDVGDLINSGEIYFGSYWSVDEGHYCVGFICKDGTIRTDIASIEVSNITIYRRLISQIKTADVIPHDNTLKVKDGNLSVVEQPVSVLEITSTASTGQLTEPETRLLYANPAKYIVTKNIDTNITSTFRYVSKALDGTDDYIMFVSNTASSNLILAFALESGETRATWMYRESEFLGSSDVIDNLESTESDLPGSANMLRVLNEKIILESGLRESGDLYLDLKKQNKLVAGSSNVHLTESGDVTILKVDVCESGSFATKEELNLEKLARESGDLELNTKITAEVNRAILVESGLQVQIEQEIVDRESGDLVLDNKITAEKERAELAESGLRLDLEAEILARESGDLILENKKQNKLLVGSTNVHLVESGNNTIISVDAAAGIDKKTIVENEITGKIETSVGGSIVDTYSSTQIVATDSAIYDVPGFTGVGYSVASYNPIADGDVVTVKFLPQAGADVIYLKRQEAKERSYVISGHNVTFTGVVSTANGINIGKFVIEGMGTFFGIYKYEGTLVIDTATAKLTVDKIENTEIKTIDPVAIPIDGKTIISAGLGEKRLMTAVGGSLDERTVTRPVVEDSTLSDGGLGDARVFKLDLASTEDFVANDKVYVKLVHESGTIEWTSFAGMSILDIGGSTNWYLSSCNGTATLHLFYKDNELYLYNNAGLTIGASSAITSFVTKTIRTYHKIDNNFIAIDNDTIKIKTTGELYATGGSGEPTKYLTDAVVSTETPKLTITKKESGTETTVAFVANKVIVSGATPTLDIHEGDIWCELCESGESGYVPYVEVPGNEPYSGTPYGFTYNLSVSESGDVELINNKLRLDNTRLTETQRLTLPVYRKTETYSKTAVDGNFLKLTGGTMTGSIVSSLKTTLMRDVNDGQLEITGDNVAGAGGRLILNGSQSSLTAGAFFLSSSDGTNTKQLIGKPDGTLTWNSNDVITAAGGTMTGQLVSDVLVPLRKNDTAGYMKIGVGTDSNLAGAPSLRVYGTSHATYPGTFMCEANNGTTQKLLIGRPDGTLTWNGKNVITSAGGTVDGIMTFTPNWSVLDRDDTDSYFQINGHKTSEIGRGSCLVLSGDQSTDSTYGGGNFALRAMKNNSTYSTLVGKPDGTLTWGGNHVFTRKVLGGDKITGLTNGTVNTSNSYAIAFGGGTYYVALLLNNVTLVRGETKIANSFQIDGHACSSITTLSGNANSSGTFFPATAVAWGGGLWVTHYEAGTGEVRLSGFVNV